MRACLCTIFKKRLRLYAYLDNNIKTTLNIFITKNTVGKAAEYVTPTARQPAHARGVLAEYDNMRPPTVRVLAFAQHKLSSSFLNITNYKSICIKNAVIGDLCMPTAR
jgi:hypothetical protein